MYLNCHTYYSLRYGTFSPRALVERAARWGVETLALTDINNTSGAYAFMQLCQAYGIHPIVGIDFRGAQGQRKFIGLAQNAEGFRELNELLTTYLRNDLRIPDEAPVLYNSWVIYPRLHKPIESFRYFELLGIRPEHVARLYGHELLEHQHKLVVWQPVTFADDKSYRLHQLLQAIDQNVVLSRLSAKKCARKTARLLAPDDLLYFYRNYPKIVQQTREVIASCELKLTTGLQINRQTFTRHKADDYDLLQKLARQGAERRYANTGEMVPKRVQERLEKELHVIRDQDFCAYFLINWDIVRYAASRGYRHVGRGSGANSLVAYCIGLTDVDPIELDLYFERFINPYRSTPPDFDIDFSWDERDEVIDYIFQRYGKQYTAMLATYSTFKGRAIIRELGKVFGLPKGEIDQIIREPQAREKHHELVEQIFYYGRMLEGFPNHLSIHAGGVLISERPLAYHTALRWMPKGIPVTHFDMHHAEAMGFHKYDILSQRGLGHIKEAVSLIRQNRGVAVDIDNLPKIKQDEKVKALLRSGQCMGCFYIESPAMRNLLTKLSCDNYVHLVAASSIIRPGVAKSGMMQEYIKRFHAPDSFSYLHPVFKEQLGETFGVMVYQEDVMKIVHHFAGLDLDESDVLRRVMSGKKAQGDTLDRLRKKYWTNCRARGYDDELIQEVWRQVESFSGYSFCKAHSASFAVESFQSLYLKAYYPVEFMVAVINNFGGFYASEYYFHEASMAGANIHPPCVNHSHLLTSVVDEDIYIGFTHLHQLERKVANHIVAARRLAGPFQSLADFVHRVDISTAQIEILIRIGAFRFTGKNKYQLMWEKNAVFSREDSWHGTLPLFSEKTEDFELPKLQEGPFDQAFDEWELLGFSLRSPFELTEREEGYDCITAAYLAKNRGLVVRIMGYYVCKKEVRTVRGQRMAFGTWLDREGSFFDTTHFSYALQQAPFRGKGVYKIEGKVVESFGCYSLEVLKMHRVPFRKDERYGDCSAELNKSANSSPNSNTNSL
jgi:DNA polymerase-3 subunit alpha